MLNADKFKPLKPDDLDIFYEWSQNHFSAKHEITSVEFLSEPDRRNVVLRIYFSGSEDVPNSVILKQSIPEESDDEEAYARFARDWAGLEFLSSIPQPMHNVPRFYGANKQLRFIVIEDLGEQHVSLVDSLTSNSQPKAIAALTRFMQTLGSFHASTFGNTEAYQNLLKKIHVDAESEQEGLAFYLGDILPKLEQANKLLGLNVTDEVIQEAKDIIHDMMTPGPFTVLTHGDICPDNVFDHEGQDLQLIDFEWAFIRHALLDGTYLRMSMPTCWCAKAIPKTVIDAMEQIYRNELTKAIPAAADDSAYQLAYVKACGFWVLQQTIPHLEGILIEDRVGPSGPVPKSSLWNPEENTVRPRFLHRLQTFIEVSSAANELPHLRKMATDMLAKTQTLWPSAKRLDYYPAFK